MNKLFKNILLFFIPLLVSSMVVVGAYLWISPRNAGILKPFFPKNYFSLSNAPLDSLKGNVASVSGKVGFVSRIASFATLINSSIKIEQGEEIDTYGNGETNIVFPKIGTIDVSANSQINFIQTLPQNFVVWQKQGLAVYSKNGDIPVSIVTGNLLINLESGKSTISLDKKTKDITVSVSSGSATVAFTSLNNNTKVLTLKKGDIYIFRDNARTGIIE